MSDVIAVECGKCKNLVRKENIMSLNNTSVCNECFQKYNEYGFERRKLFDKIGNFAKVLKNYNCFVAGGAITSVFTNKEINDIDIYFRSKDDLRNFMINNELFIVYATDKSFTFKEKDVVYQAIFFDTFKSAEDIFDRFDFTVCMGAYDFKTDEFILHKDFFRHNSQRVLRVNNATDYPIISALRVDKYKKKGYNISKAEFIKILMAVNKLKIENFQEFKSHCGGMYGENFDKIFKDIENEEFDINKALEKLDEIETNKYMEKEVDFGELSYEEFVCNCMKAKVDTIAEISEGKYVNKEFEIFSINEDNKYLYNIIDKKELFKFPLSFYKDVRKKDNRYTSFYDSSFEYRLGEEVIPKGDGIYCYSKIEKSRQYSHNKDSVLIELTVDNFEDINCTRYKNLTLKKCKFVGEVEEKCR